MLQHRANCQSDRIYALKTGKILFQSEALFETIKASSNEMQGLVNIDKKTFAFKVRMASFIGFNSKLQNEHFNENYVETVKFPEAGFNGKIIEDIDFTEDGTYIVRAKGNLSIHGVPQERIIKCEVVIKNKKISVKSIFSILLTDYNIPIPKVVKDKLNGEITVQVFCLLEAH